MIENKIKLKLSLFSLLYLMFNYNLYSQDDLNINELSGGDKLNTITTAVPFLMISPDSRSGAMGDVGVATSPDANSLHWNPAKFAFIEDEVGFAVSYVPWLRALVPDINLSYLTGYKKFNKNESIGAELRYFSLGNIVFTNQAGDVVGQGNPHELALATAYSRKLSRDFSLAISGRYIFSNLAQGQIVQGQKASAGTSYAADVAGYYQQSIRISKQDIDLAVGANISNIGSKIAYTNTDDNDFIPINLRIGTSMGTDFDDYNKLSIAFDINKLLVPTPPEYDSNNNIVAGKEPNVAVVTGMFQSFGDAPGGAKEEFREINFSFGTEYWYADQFAVRAGYFNEHDTKGGRKYFTFGSGVKYNVFALDFSYLVNASRAINGNNPLANTMRFTLVFDFGAFQQEG
tara:strand:+ start:456 stop:1661 length:1206 start_codon:yes stop_codon:yes gene_type:complete